MGNIRFADCQDVRGQKQIREIECPNCHEPGGIEVFLKDGLTVGDPITVILFSDGTAEVLDVAPVNEEGEASFVTKGF